MNIEIVYNELQCHRIWQNIISFSIYGNDPKYIQGAIENAKIAHVLYKKWTIRIYYDSSVSLSAIYELRGLDVELVDMSSSLLPAMQWRFLPMDDQEVSHFIVRAADSRLNARESAVVNEWVVSGKAFHTMRNHTMRNHTMRNHPRHNLHFMRGMWGAKGGAIPDMQTEMKNFNSDGTHSNAWDKDQNFLDAVLPRFVNANNTLMSLI